MKRSSFARHAKSVTCYKRHYERQFADEHPEPEGMEIVHEHGLAALLAIAQHADHDVFTSRVIVRCIACTPEGTPYVRTWSMLWLVAAAVWVDELRYERRRADVKDDVDKAVTLTAAAILRAYDNDLEEHLALSTEIALMCPSTSSHLEYARTKPVRDLLIQRASELL